MIDLLAYPLIIIALIFMALGVIGLFRFKDFYSRTLKIFLVTLMVMVTNPLSTHAIARSAFLSGYTINQEPQR